MQVPSITQTTPAIAALRAAHLDLDRAVQSGVGADSLADLDGGIAHLAKGLSRLVAAGDPGQSKDAITHALRDMKRVRHALNAGWAHVLYADGMDSQVASAAATASTAADALEATLVAA